MPKVNALNTYLQDHLGGATMGVELARKFRDEYAGTPAGPFLADLAREIEEDKATLEQLMDHLGVEQDQLKQAAGWLAERLSRLKLSDVLTGDADLKRLMEFEVLSLGIEGKLTLWHSLMHIADAHSELSTIDLAALAKRAESQRADLEVHRLRAARDALVH